VEFSISKFFRKAHSAPEPGTLDLCCASDGNQHARGAGVEPPVDIFSDDGAQYATTCPVLFFIIARTQKNEHNQPSNKNGSLFFVFFCKLFVFFLPLECSWKKMEKTNTWSSTKRIKKFQINISKLLVN